MDASADEVLRLFRKWETASSLILATFRSADAGASCVGFISVLESDLIVICAPDDKGQPTGNAFYVLLDEVAHYDYSDSGELDPGIRPAFDFIVRMTMKNGVSITVNTQPE